MRIYNVFVLFLLALFGLSFSIYEISNCGTYSNINNETIVLTNNIDYNSDSSCIILNNVSNTKLNLNNKYVNNSFILYGTQPAIQINSNCYNITIENGKVRNFKGTAISSTANLITLNYMNISNSVNGFNIPLGFNPGDRNYYVYNSVFYNIGTAISESHSGNSGNNKVIFYTVNNKFYNIGILTDLTNCYWAQGGLASYYDEFYNVSYLHTISTSCSSPGGGGAEFNYCLLSNISYIQNRDYYSGVALKYCWGNVSYISLNNNIYYTDLNTMAISRINCNNGNINATAMNLNGGNYFTSCIINLNNTDYFSISGLNSFSNTVLNVKKGGSINSDQFSFSSGIINVYEQNVNILTLNYGYSFGGFLRLNVYNTSYSHIYSNSSRSSTLKLDDFNNISKYKIKIDVYNFAQQSFKVPDEVLPKGLNYDLYKQTDYSFIMKPEGKNYYNNSIRIYYNPSDFGFSENELKLYYFDIVDWMWLPVQRQYLNVYDNYIDANISNPYSGQATYYTILGGEKIGLYSIITYNPQPYDFLNKANITFTFTPFAKNVTTAYCSVCNISQSSCTFPKQVNTNTINYINTELPQGENKRIYILCNDALNNTIKSSYIEPIYSYPLINEKFRVFDGTKEYNNYTVNQNSRIFIRYKFKSIDITQATCILYEKIGNNYLALGNNFDIAVGNESGFLFDPSQLDEGTHELYMNCENTNYGFPYNSIFYNVNGFFNMSEPLILNIKNEYMYILTEKNVYQNDMNIVRGVPGKYDLLAPTYENYYAFEMSYDCNAKTYGYNNEEIRYCKSNLLPESTYYDYLRYLLNLQKKADKMNNENNEYGLEDMIGYVGQHMNKEYILYLRNPDINENNIPTCTATFHLYYTLYTNLLTPDIYEYYKTYYPNGNNNPILIRNGSASVNLNQIIASFGLVRYDSNDLNPVSFEIACSLNNTIYNTTTYYVFPIHWFYVYSNTNVDVNEKTYSLDVNYDMRITKDNINKEFLCYNYFYNPSNPSSSFISSYFTIPTHLTNKTIRYDKNYVDNLINKTKSTLIKGKTICVYMNYTLESNEFNINLAKISEIKYFEDYSKALSVITFDNIKFFLLLISFAGLAYIGIGSNTIVALIALILFSTGLLIFNVINLFMYIVIVISSLTVFLYLAKE